MKLIPQIITTAAVAALIVPAAFAAAPHGALTTGAHIAAMKKMGMTRKMTGQKEIHKKTAHHTWGGKKAVMHHKWAGKKTMMHKKSK